MIANSQTSIAVVDNHNLFRKGIIKLINLADKENRYQVLFEANNGQELIHHLQEMHVLPDIILMDIDMPDMDGYEAVQWLKVHHPGIRILVISMFATEEAVIKMIRLGVDGYLSKDIEVEDVHQALEAIAANQRHFAPFVVDILRDRVVDGRTETGDNIQLPEKLQTFLELCCSDLNYADIAEKMFASPKTIDGYRAELFKRFDVKTRVALVLYAVKHNLVKL